jgi:hypothetical protein
MTNWFEAMQNPRGWTLRKTLYEFLKARYQKNEEILDRISLHLVTEKDNKQFFQLITDVYEMGFLQAVEQQKSQLEKLGLKVNITSDKKDD